MAVRSKAGRLGIKKICYDVPEGYRHCSKCGGIFTKEEMTSRDYCKPCRRLIYRDKKIEKTIQQIKEEKGVFEIEKHIEETAQMTYTCTWCGETKKGEEFKYDKRRHHRESICRTCRSKKNQESRIQSIKEGRGW